MPTSDDNASAHIVNNSPSLADKLREIDDAYLSGAREECIQMVTRVYAYLDNLTSGVASCSMIAALTALDLIGVTA